MLTNTQGRDCEPMILRLKWWEGFQLLANGIHRHSIFFVHFYIQLLKTAAYLALNVPIRVHS